MPRILLAIACLTTTVAALRLSPALRAPHRVSRATIAAVVQDLPTGWITGVDEQTGQTYFFNEQTGQSQWDPPASHGGDYTQQDYALPAGWISGFDQESGAMYYVNEQTGQSQWDPPSGQGYGAQQVLWHVTSASGHRPWIDKRWTDEPRFGGVYAVGNGKKAVLGRYDVDEKKPTRPWVSREQCHVVVADDGSATLVSHGKGPTLWSDRGAPWVALQDGEQVPLSDGDLISIDAMDPDGSILNVQMGYPSPMGI